MISAFARERVRNNNALNIRAAEKADGFIKHGGNPIRMAVIRDFKIRRIQKRGGILKSDMADKLFVEKLRGAVFNTAAELLVAVHNGNLL